MKYFDGFICKAKIRPRKDVISIIRPANCSVKISEHLVWFIQAILLESFSDLEHSSIFRHSNVVFVVLALLVSVNKNMILSHCIPICLQYSCMFKIFFPYFLQFLQYFLNYHSVFWFFVHQAINDLLDFLKTYEILALFENQFTFFILLFLHY